ncbi:hypothetical protein [Rhodococcus sp. ACPA4]|nr:hypothetical protein [Rhodococcus sp. ACPA4]
MTSILVAIRELKIDPQQRDRRVMVPEDSSGPSADSVDDHEVG